MKIAALLTCLPSCGHAEGVGTKGVPPTIDAKTPAAGIEQRAKASP